MRLTEEQVVNRLMAACKSSALRYHPSSEREALNTWYADDEEAKPHHHPRALKAVGVVYSNGHYYDSEAEE